MRQNRRKGDFGEKLAAEALQQAGYAIVAANYRCYAGEIDIIARKTDTLAFVEVKYRKSLKCGYPAEAVTASKQRRIRAVAEHYIHFNKPSAEVFRFDVIQIINAGELIIEHIENAF